MIEYLIPSKLFCTYFFSEQNCSYKNQTDQTNPVKRPPRRLIPAKKGI